MNKKKIVTVCLVAALMVTALIGGSLAYFTDTENATNTFTVGNVDIELTEDGWIDGSTANPGVAVTKKPVVNNIGENEAWIRVNVTISDAAAFKAAMQAHNITDLATVFAGHDEDYWKRASITEDADADTITYSYYYKEKVAKNASTQPIFTSVTIPAAFTSAEMAAINGDNKDGFKIIVTADAIQTAGLDTVEKAFAAFDAE